MTRLVHSLLLNIGWYRRMWIDRHNARVMAGLDVKAAAWSERDRRLSEAWKG